MTIVNVTLAAYIYFWWAFNNILRYDNNVTVTEIEKQLWIKFFEKNKSVEISSISRAVYNT